MFANPASAGGPRYVTGPPFFTGAPGVPVGWRQTQLSYYTDAGNLSTSVSHAAADEMVAAAAAVWNLSVANIAIAQGGELAEHVSAQNTYLGPNGVVFPADVMSASAAAVPIAVIYDTDGSVTDMLLGAGASGPAECEQNGVTESVDLFDPQGYILHAVIVVNGRCTAKAAAAQLQLQYQLMRVFGRVLGLAWSQTNDNVFTGATTPTYAQEMDWPIMHPIDIICGSYSYQCMANPFTLRPDDVAAMVEVYPVPQGGAGMEKQFSYQQATGLLGLVTFPTGAGMAGVNVLVRRQSANAIDAGYEASAVTGTLFRRANVSPFMTAGTDAISSEGTWDQGRLGYYVMAWIPMPAGQFGVNLLLTLEDVNPLYAGEHSVGPYAAGNVAMSGAPPAIATDFGVDEGGVGEVDVQVPTAAAACGSGTDGTAGAPAAAAATGWWNGLLCGYGHASYVTMAVQPARTFTVEVTALDENGLATTAKAMPVIGVFAPADGPYDLPSVAVAPAAFQALGVGTTRVEAATASLTSLRVGIADQRGDGRPDFRYQARIFYADSVTPARIATAGATVTIAGSGFRAGNAVAINGTPVTVMSWSASAIVVRAPAMAAVGASDKLAVDVTVTDGATGAVTTETAALTYDSAAGLPDTMRLLSAPAAATYVGDAATTAFAVQVVEADGVTPVVGDTVVFSVTAGAAVFGCGGSPCSVVTNAQGMAQVSVMPTAAGTVAVQAADGALTQSASFMALTQIGAIVVLAAPAGALNVQVEAATPFAVQVLDANGNPLGNVPVTFSATAGGATFSKCANATCVVTSDGGGGAGTWLTPTTLGTVTVRASVGDVGQSVSFTGASNVDTMQIVTAPMEPAYVNETAGTFTVQLLHPDGSGDGNEPVTFSAPAGVQFEACGTNLCTGMTDWTGTLGLITSGLAAGVYPLVATFGAVRQTQLFTVSNHSYALNVVSVPGPNAKALNTAATPLAVQLVEDGVNPVGWASVVLSGARGDEVMGCGQEFCTVVTDANGMAATTVTPLRGGVIPLNAEYPPVTVTTSFTAVGVAQSLRVVDTVGLGGAQVGVTQLLMVQMIGTDGVTPVPYHDLIYTVTSGSFLYTSCSAATCLVRTDANGYAAIAGTAWAAGPVVAQVTDGTVLQVFQFNGVAPPDVLRVVTAPASGGVAGKVEATPFTVQVLFSDAVTPVSGRSVTVSVTNGLAGLAACAGAASCSLTADPNGMISTPVTPLAAGMMTLTVTDGGVTATASFTALPPPDVLSVSSAPGNGALVGIAAGFSLRLTLADGVTPDAGRTLLLTANGASLGCGAASCSLVTDANGLVTTSVTPGTAGVVTLTGAFGNVTQTVTFIAASKPDAISWVSTPGPSVFQGATAGAPLAVKVVLSDGVTPVAGIAVTFAAAPGAQGGVSFAACGAGSCVVVTGTDGVASTTLTGLQAGAVALTAAAAAPGVALTLTTALTVLANQYQVTTTNVTVYVAEGASVPVMLAITAARNGSAAVGQAVHWVSSGGFLLAAGDTITDASGASSVQAMLGPLAGGAQAGAAACAWTAVCASFSGSGVAQASLEPVLVSGGAQAVSAGAAYAPVRVMVTDGNGHAVAGAAISVYQTVTALDGSCPVRGRCPAAPVLGSNVVVTVSGMDGMVWVTPLTGAGATQTEIAASVGTQGFLTTVLESQP